MTIEIDLPADTSQRRFGPVLLGNETLFRLWAPSQRSAELLIRDREPIAMQRAADGFWEARVRGAAAGARYKFRAAGITFPDLASRRQDGDTAGWSVVCDPLDPPRDRRPVRPWHETVICEVHIGTASPEGTFAGLMNRLEHFRDAGYTALEVMPVNEFPGSRNWGYDGTLIFAPHAAYGTADELRALVDRAHELGLGLVLDVVYNHFGEVDNFVERYAPEWFDDEIETPWGPGIDFRRPMVRQFYYENAVMWLAEYDFDGLRFDSVHEMKTEARDTFLGELAAAARKAKSDARLIIENMKNQARWLERNDRNEPMTFTAQWNDDIHHVMDFLVTGEGRKTGYDDPSKDPYADLEKALADGFIHDPGEGDDSDGRTRGGPASRLPPDSFVSYLENHDQIGNRADARRVADRISAEKIDFLNFLKFLAPQIPLCFMGDEAQIRTPFPYFIDLGEAEAKAKRDDRYRQMREIFHEDVEEGGLPDPNDAATFTSARLDWNEFGLAERRAALERFRELARFRRELLWPLAATPCLDARTARHGNGLIVTWVFEAGALSMALNASDHSIDIGCLICNHAVSTGDYSQHGDVLRMAPWTAVAWRS